MSGNKRTKKPAAGLGDIVAKVTEAIGVKPCVGCNSRKDLLNVHFPFGTPKEMTDEQMEWFGTFDKEQGKVLSNENATKLFELYNDTFGVKVQECRSCSGLIIAIIKKLRKLYDVSNTKLEDETT